MLLVENLKNRIYYKPNLNNIQMVKLFEQIERERAESFFSDNPDMFSVICELLKTVPAGYIFSFMIPVKEKRRTFQIFFVYDEKVSENISLDIEQKPLYFKPQLYFIDIARFDKLCKKFMNERSNLLKRRIILYNESFFYQVLSI